MLLCVEGIVHGTTITIKNAGRKYLSRESMEGVVYVSSGLGGDTPPVSPCISRVLIMSGVSMMDA